VAGLQSLVYILEYHHEFYDCQSLLESYRSGHLVISLPALHDRDEQKNRNASASRVFAVCCCLSTPPSFILLTVRPTPKAVINESTVIKSILSFVLYGNDIRRTLREMFCTAHFLFLPSPFLCS